MRKRIVALFLVLTMAVCLMPVSAFADNAKRDYQNNLPNMTGVLVGDDGSRYIIEGTVVSIERFLISDTNSATIKYELPAAIMNRTSITEDGIDGGIASVVYLTITYSSKNTPKEYLLTNVSGYWDITDSKTTVESAYLSYGCSGMFPNPTSQAVNDLPVTNDFDEDTGFTNYVTSDIYAVMGANLTLNYLMGASRRWSFTLTNNLFNT